MYPALLFATTQLKITPTDNTLAGFVIVLYIAAILGIIGMAAWYFIPIIHRRRKQIKAAEIEAANAIWLDSYASEIHCGHKKMRIEPKSFEYYICRVVFSVTSKYHKDLDIFDKVDRAKETGRGVEQGVRRLNKKFKELGLNDDLFKRSKERTTVNNQYHQKIVKN